VKRFKLLAQVLGLGFLCLLLGVAVPLLPLQITVIGAVLLSIPFLVVVVWQLPNLKQDPSKALKWLLLASMFLYCIWPRNVFIPVPALPVKHPQKMLYFMTLAFAFYAFIKSAEIRSRLTQVWHENRFLLSMVLALVLWAALTIGVSQAPISSAFFWTQELLYVWALVPLLAIALRTTEDFQHLVAVLLAAAVVNVGYAIPEVIWHRNIFESVTTLAEIDPAMARQLYAAKARGGAHRAQAAFEHPLLFAEFLAVLLPLCVVALAMPRLRKWALVALPCMALGLLLSVSRVAAVASAVGVFVLLVFVLLRNAVLAKRSAWPLVGTLITVPVVLALVPLLFGGMDALLQGRNHTEYHSTLARQQMLMEGVGLVADSWAMGYGPGMGTLTLNFQNGDGAVTLDNYLLILALDSGAVALCLYLLLILTLAIRLGALALNSQQAGLISAAVLGSLCAFLAVKTVLGTNLNNFFVGVFLIAVCILSSASRSLTDKARSSA
jgi:hypothetical protein